jgi:hypothetical protein
MAVGVVFLVVPVLASTTPQPQSPRVVPVAAGARQAKPPATSGGAQDKPQAKPVAPEDQAFRDALAIKDPQAKLRAFQRLLKDWPESPAVKNGAVDFNIFSLSCTATAESAKEARRAADAFLAGVPADDRDKQAIENFLMAFGLVRADVMWADVERYARKSLEYWDSRGTATPPRTSGVDLQRPAVLTVLGQALVKQGRDDEAEPFFRQAYLARADEPGVVGEVVPHLLDSARKRGRADEQVEYLTALALYGRLTPERRRELEDTWRSSHNGSIDGLEAMLDTRYEAELPAAIPVTPFERNAAPGARTVLAEMFTGSSCAPCVGMDLAFESALRRYGARDLAVLVYHQHVPAPDPLANPSGLARFASYSGGGVPAAFIDGAASITDGGGKATEAAGIYRTGVQPAIERAMAVPAGARIALRATRNGDIIHATVSVDQVSKTTAAVTLQVALVEARVRYSGSNGIRFHPMVVRKLVGDGAGVRVTAGGRTTTDQVFDIAAIRRELKTYLDDFEANNTTFGKITFAEKKYDLDAANLRVVAFVEVQDEHGRRVLQAAVAALR